jgi:hypothetical protein
VDLGSNVTAFGYGGAGGGRGRRPQSIYGHKLAGPHVLFLRRARYPIPSKSTEDM